MWKIWEAIWNRRRFEADLADELQFHIERLADDLERGGLTRQEALRRARLELGSAERYKEECRRARGLQWLDELRADLLYAGRGLRRNPVFAIVAIVTLALGIGANATIFALVNSVMFKALPVHDPEELQAVYWTAPAGRPQYAHSTSGSSFRDGAMNVRDMFSYPHFLQLRDDLPPQVELFGHHGLGRVNVVVNGQAQLASGLATSWNYFRALGIEAQRGRTFLPEDENANQTTSAVLLGHDYWMREFGGSPSVLGQAIGIADASATVAGILPPGFRGVNPGQSVDIVIPLSLAGRIARRPVDDPRSWWLRLMARLQPGYAPEQFRSELETRLVALMRANPIKEPYETPKIRLMEGARGLHWLRSQFEQPLRLLMIVAILILLMATVNVAGLLLARSETRVAETGTRLALGAGRSRLARQHLTESLLLASLGLLAGLALAVLLSNAVPSLIAQDGRSPVVDLAPDARFMMASVIVTLGVAFLFGLYPAWKSSRLELTASLKRTHGARTGRMPLGRVLVGAQVGLSLVLLIAAALFLRTVANLRSIDLGFAPQRLLIFSAAPSLAGYEEARLQTYFKRALERLQSTPGVRSVAVSRHAILSGSSSSAPYFYRQPGGDMRQIPESFIHQINPQYFETYGIPLLAGRNVSASDTSQSRQVAVVNQRLALLVRPDGGSPVGLSIFEDEKGAQPVEIIGVAGDVKYDRLRREPPLTVYAPFEQRLVRNGVFALKIDGDPLAFASTARRVMAEVDPRVPIFDIRTQEEQVNLAMERERILARLLTGFGILALVLAAIGIYGVLSYSVSRRTSEIGIRLALGAAPSTLRRMVLRESLLPIGIGLAAGLSASWWFTRLLETFVFGVKPMDGWSIAAAVTMLGLGAMLAAWMPARRASKVEPMTALRYE